MKFRKMTKTMRWVTWCGTFIVTSFLIERVTTGDPTAIAVLVINTVASILYNVD